MTLKQLISYHMEFYVTTCHMSQLLETNVGNNKCYFYVSTLLGENSTGSQKFSSSKN